jgi:hypothetical protein
MFRPGQNVGGRRLQATLIKRLPRLRTPVDSRIGRRMPVPGRDVARFSGSTTQVQDEVPMVLVVLIRHRGRVYEDLLRLLQER